MKAVIARILGFPSLAEVFCCARTTPQLKIKASNVAAAKQRRNRIETTNSGRMDYCSCKCARHGEHLISIQDSLLSRVDGILVEEWSELRGSRSANGYHKSRDTIHE